MLQTTATIKPGRGILTLINTFTVAPDDQEALVASLADVTERTMRHLPGFLAASVHKSLDGRHVANYVQWESRAHFEAMLQGRDAKAHMEHVQSSAISVLPILYDVAYVGAAAE